MRKIILYCLLAILLVSGMPASYAGFRIKPAETTTITNTLPVNENNTGKKSFFERKVPRFIMSHSPIPFNGKDGKGHRTGWPGIVSLVCGILALFSFRYWLLLGLCAVVFGAIGLNARKHRNTGMAIAGLILGCIEMLLFLLLIAIFAVFVL